MGSLAQSSFATDVGARWRGWSMGLLAALAVTSGAHAASSITASTFVDAIDPAAAQVVSSSFAQPCIPNPTNPAFPPGVNCLTTGSATPTTLTYTGFTRRLTSVTANGTLFVPTQGAPTSVVVNRNNAPAGGHDPNRVVLFADLANNTGAAATSIASSSNVYLRAPYAKTVESAFALSVLNLGIDNVFQNADDGTSNNFNNIESLDFVFSPTLATASNLTRTGFAVIERGGNDDFQIAGLRGSGGSCSSLTRLPLVEVPFTSWTGAAAIYSRTDVIARRDPGTEAEMRPDNNASQPLRGLLFRFADLGFAAGDTVCGYAVYAWDATGTDPSNPSQNPTNSSDNFMLDLVASVSLYSADADMAVAVSPLPALLGPGQTVTGQTLTCTSVGAAPATAASCAVTPDVGTVSNLVCTPPAGGTVAVGDAIACTYDYTAPGTPGGAVLATSQVTLTATTGASNDSNPNNNTAQRSAPLIDAVNDPFGPVGPAGSPNAGNVLTNDRNGGTPNVPVGDVVISVTTPATPIGGGTVPVLNPGTGEVSVPPNTPPGSYTIEYQICSATLPAACDNATVTLTVTAQFVPPSLNPDQSLGNPPGTAVTVPVLPNDVGASSPMDPNTVRIVGPGGPLTSLSVPGQGVWVVNPNGTITFTPEPGFPGDPTPIQYTASNTNGDPAGPTTVTVTYTRPITAVPIDSPWALALMALAMAGLVARRLRRARP